MPLPLLIPAGIGLYELAMGTLFVGSAVGAGVAAGTAINQHNSQPSTPQTPAADQNNAQQTAEQSLTNAPTAAAGGCCPPPPGKDPKRENKKKHIFDKPQHKLNQYLQSFNGDQDAALDALQNAAQNMPRSPTGPFQGVVNVNGFNVTVRGATVNGVAQLGTAFIP